MIRRVTSRTEQHCVYCDWPIPTGEPHFLDTETQTIGCTHRCCRDGAKATRQMDQRRMLIAGMSHTYATVGG